METKKTQNKAFENLIESMPSVTAIVGMAKNSGKTVVLNHLLKRLNQSGVNLGVTSIGRDGEAEDTLTLTEKPAITLYQNQYFATGQKLLFQSDLEYKILRETEIETYFGKVIIGVALSTGEIQLSGGNTNEDHLKIIHHLKSFGCEKILLDGAMDRQAVISPKIVDGFILATGAVLNPKMEKVIELTKARIQQFSLEQVDERLKALCEIEFAKSADAVNSVGIYNEGEHAIKWLEALQTALESSQEIARKLTENDRTVILKGSLTQRLLDQLERISPHFKSLTFVIEDGTKIFMEAEKMRRFEKMGIQFKVLYPQKLLAITLNPTSPTGENFEAEEFLNRARAAFEPLIVIDVCI